MSTAGLGNRGEFEVPYHFVAPYLDGAYLAANALPDAYLVYDAHDCGYQKAEKVAGAHDLFSDLLRWQPMNRVVRTGLDTPDYVVGSDDKLSKKLRQVVDRYRPGIIFVARSNVVVASGHDADRVLRDFRKRSQVPVAVIPERNAEKDYVTGYLDAVEGALEHAFRGPSGAGVAAVGYLFDRNEGDRLGDVAELRRLLAGIGVPRADVVLDGSPFGPLRGACRPSAVVGLAPGWSGSSRLAERCEASHVEPGLPVGLAGTTRWLHEVAGLMNLEAQSFVDRELDRVAPKLEWLIPRFLAGRQVVVFADRLLLKPLLAFLEEIGLVISGVGCTSEPATGPSFLAELAGSYNAVPSAAPDLRDHLTRLRRDNEVELVLGNSIVHQLAAEIGLPCVELCYPCNYQHALSPRPVLGFAGVEVLVERMLNAMLAPGGA